MKLRDSVAELEHDVWSNWMRYMFSKCSVDVNGNLVIPKDLEERWARQMNTTYVDLPDEEKESDLELADKFLKLVTLRV